VAVSKQVTELRCDAGAACKAAARRQLARQFPSAANEGRRFLRRSRMRARGLPATSAFSTYTSRASRVTESVSCFDTATNFSRTDGAS
jgi:hypothetical protein